MSFLSLGNPSQRAEAPLATISVRVSTHCSSIFRLTYFSFVAKSSAPAYLKRAAEPFGLRFHIHDQVRASRSRL
jgi:hypothetical protein